MKIWMMFFFRSGFCNFAVTLHGRVRVILYTPRRQKKLFQKTFSKSVFCGDTATGLIHRFYVAGDKKKILSFYHSKKNEMCTVLCCYCFAFVQFVIYCTVLSPFLFFLSPVTSYTPSTKKVFWKVFCEKMKSLILYFYDFVLFKNGV